MQTEYSIQYWCRGNGGDPDRSDVVVDVLNFDILHALGHILGKVGLPPYKGRIDTKETSG